MEAPAGTDVEQHAASVSQQVAGGPDGWPAGLAHIFRAQLAREFGSLGLRPRPW